MKRQGKVELARKLANLAAPVFIEAEPSRPTRFTAGELTQKRRMKALADSVTALLEKEQERLIKTWNQAT